MNVRNLRNSARQSGFTMVELMIGVLIGLVAIVVMFQVFAVAESQKRTTAGTGDAQQEGVSSLYLMERDARMAGYGMNYFPLLGCNVWGYWNPSGKVFNFTLAPAVITHNAANVPDKLRLAYANVDTMAFPAGIGAPNSTDKTPGYVWLERDPTQFKTGDLFIAGEVPVSPNPMKDCSLFQATFLDFTKNAVRFSDLFYVDDGTLVTYPAKYTPPTASAGTQVAPHNPFYAYWTNATSSGGRVMDIGNDPTVVEYSVVNNQLVAKNVLNPDDTGVVVADNIVQFKAQYGWAYWDNTGTNPCALNPTVLTPCRINPSNAIYSARIVPGTPQDQWADDLPASPYVMQPNDWRRIIAVRFIIVARSGNKERKSQTTGLCTATTVMPKWVVNNTTIDVSNTGDPDWGCYRYKTFETVVPIRNLMWFPDPNGATGGTAAS